MQPSNEVRLTEERHALLSRKPDSGVPSNEAYGSDLKDEETGESVSLASKPSLWVRVGTELRELARTFFPTLITLLLNKFPWIISLRFVADLGSEELAAAALATTIFNVTGLSLSVGLSSAVSTLTGQARGDLLAKRAKQQNTNGPEKAIVTEIKSEFESKTPLLPLVFLYRGLFIQLAFTLPIGLWWSVGIEPVLLALGQEEVLSSMTAAYLRILTPGLWAYAIHWTLTPWLQAIEMSDIPAMSVIVGVLCHVPLNYLFIYGLGWGYLGAASASVVFQIIQPVLPLAYFLISQYGRERMLDSLGAKAAGRNSLSLFPEATIAISSLSGILQYLALALPGILIISEWWASEISIFLSGRLSPSPELALGAMALYQSINTLCFMFPAAMSTAGATRVGNTLGAGEPEAAAFASNISVVAAGCISLVLGITLLVTPHEFFPSLFAPSAYDVIAETSKTIPLLAIYVLADGLQVTFGGIVKGSGRQLATVPIVLFAYWVVGVPLAYYLAFIKHDGEMCSESTCGVVGLVTGMTTGTCIHMCGMAAIILGCTNWKQEARKAQERLSNK